MTLLHSKKSLLPILLGTFLLTLVTSCGFQLRGTYDLSAEGVYVDDRIGIQERSLQPVSDQLIKDLEAITEISDMAGSGPGVLIVAEELQERSLSLGSNLFNYQIELEKQVTYQILGAEGERLANASAMASREMIENQSSPAVNDQQREILIDAINTDISHQIIRHLGLVLSTQ